MMKVAGRSFLPAPQWAGAERKASRNENGLEKCQAGIFGLNIMNFKVLNANFQPDTGVGSVRLTDPRHTKMKD